METRKNIKFKLMRTLPEVLEVRRLRNECRTYMTNHTAHISTLRQIWWYLTYYRKAVNSNTYRLFIARNIDSLPVGYGALSLQNKQLYVTECVATQYRRQGYGEALLNNLISIARREKLPLIAEIWATNKGSVALHTKYGFVLDKMKTKAGASLYIYKYKYA